MTWTHKSRRPNAAATATQDRRICRRHNFFLTDALWATGPVTSESGSQPPTAPSIRRGGRTPHTRGTRAPEHQRAAPTRPSTPEGGQTTPRAGPSPPGATCLNKRVETPQGGWAGLKSARGEPPLCKCKCSRRDQLASRPHGRNITRHGCCEPPTWAQLQHTMKINSHRRNITRHGC